MKNSDLKFKFSGKFFLVSLFVFCWLIIPAFVVFAGTPSGVDWFQLITDHQTGSDATGDGGTGDGNDLNYYYVGQTFTGTIQINSDTGSNASNIWIDYDTATATAANITTGSYFANWSGQTISGGRVKSTGYRTSGYSSGLGTFGTVDFTMLQPTNANYATSTPMTLDINIGTVGLTTESNISRNGSDVLDDAEDFQINIWADTKKPYALNSSPSDGATGVSVTSNYTFDLRDSKNGEGDNTGVGTGVDTSTVVLTFDDGGGATSYTAYDSYSCSGIWGTNLCSATVNPDSPLSISGDTRNWEYSTIYTVAISGFQDFASASQDYLGDANGPNAMDAKSWTFTTESDTVAPQVTSETPTRSSTGNATTTNVVVEVTDRKTYPSGSSGSGVDASTCSINISSPTFTLVTYQQGDSGVTTTAIDYGYRFTINPASNFGENETVSVSVYDCQDTAISPNIMVTDNYSFTTSDTGSPYVDGLSPANDASIDTDGTITFHIKDDGGGVNLTDTFIYVNGNYYSNGGGAVSITTTGTSITYATSSDFNGSNYSGDTTGVSGTASDYTFVIDPENDFATGEAVPIIIYSSDTDGNLMERVVYALPAASASCSAGSTYCGTNTSWNGSQCVGTGGSSSSSSAGGGGPLYLMTAKIDNVTISQIDENSVVISWFNGTAGTGWVAYDTISPKISSGVPYYGYRYMTEPTKDKATYHTIVVRGLEPGKLYYFMPASQITDTHFINGREVQMSPRFAINVVKEYVADGNKVVCSQESPKETVIYKEVQGECPLNVVEVKEPEKTPVDIVPTEKDKIFFIIPQDIYDSSPFIVYGLISLIILVGLNTIRLINRLADTTDKIVIGEHKNRKLISYIIATIVVIILLIVMAAQMGWIWSANKIQKSIIVSSNDTTLVSGVIIEPINHQGVMGVDLSVGDTNIHTDKGGYFVFNNLKQGDSIKINHPLLRRTVEKIIDGGRMNILFDVNLFNSLSEIIDLELRGNYASIYEKLPLEIKNKISEVEFASEAINESKKFTGNISDQRIVIGKEEIIREWVSEKYDVLFEKVLNIEVYGNGNLFDYYFVNIDGGWFIIK